MQQIKYLSVSVKVEAKNFLEVSNISTNNSSNDSFAPIWVLQMDKRNKTESKCSPLLGLEAGYTW